MVGRKELLRVIGASNKLDWCLNFKRTVYDQKIASGIRLTEAAKSWARQTLIPITNCLVSHCGGDKRMFIEKYSEKFNLGKFKSLCKCDE